MMHLELVNTHHIPMTNKQVDILIVQNKICTHTHGSANMTLIYAHVFVPSLVVPYRPRSFPSCKLNLQLSLEWHIIMVIYITYMKVLAKGNITTIVVTMKEALINRQQSP